ncbi:5-hydroxytryptamine receptor 1D-like [Leptodactylus fuscus]
MNISTEDKTTGSSSILQGTLGTLMIVMCVTAVTGNLLIIIITASTKHFHSVTSIFFINLAVSDFLVGVGVMPLVATSVIYNRWVNHQYLCSYMGSAFIVYCTSSILTLAAIAVDRYRAIIDCLQYSTRTTMKRAISTVIWIWTQAMFSGLPPFVGWGHVEYLPSMFSCSVNWAHSPTYTSFIMSFSFLVPSCTMVFCYIRIVQVARDHVRRIHNIESQLQKNAKSKVAFMDKMSPKNADKIVSDPDTEESQNSIHTSHVPISGCSQCKKQDIFAIQTPGREYNGTFRLFLVILIFFCCWVPYIIVSILQSITVKGHHRRLPPLLETISAWLALLNSAINPLLYALLSKSFRRAFSSMKQRVFFKMNFFLQDVPVTLSYGNAKSNIRGIQMLQPNMPVRHFENQIHMRSISMFSIASFAETGQEDEGYIPMKFTGLSSSAMWRSRSTSDVYHDGILLKPEGLGKQYLDIPCLPFEPLSSCQIVEEDKADSSVFIFGNITVQVNESNYVCGTQP